MNSVQPTKIDSYHGDSVTQAFQQHVSGSTFIRFCNQIEFGDKQKCSVKTVLAKTDPAPVLLLSKSLQHRDTCSATASVDYPPSIIMLFSTTLVLPFNKATSHLVILTLVLVGAAIKCLKSRSIVGTVQHSKYLIWALYMILFQYISPITLQPLSVMSFCLFT